jgi:hypothetical protein
VATAAYLVLGLNGGTTPPTGSSYPTGKRTVRIRPMDETGWLLSGYSTGDVIGWINDLEPTTLNRYTSGPLDPSLQLPSAPGGPMMTTAEFLQSSLDACKNPNPTSIFPRITFDLFAQGGNGPFLEAAQQIYNLYHGLDPPQTLLSIDNYNNGSNPGDAESLAKSLYGMGWTGLAWGACGASNIPKGIGTFAMICVNPSTGAVNNANLASLESIGGYGEFEAQIDFPAEMSKFAALTPDKMADILTSLAEGQSVGGYHYMYPIIQERSANTSNTFGWDCTRVFTSASGKYGGKSLYEVMKGLMQVYD